MAGGVGHVESPVPGGDRGGGSHGLWTSFTWQLPSCEGSRRTVAEHLFARRAEDRPAVAESAAQPGSVL